MIFQTWWNQIRFPIRKLHITNTKTAHRWWCTPLAQNFRGRGKLISELEASLAHRSSSRTAMRPCLEKKPEKKRYNTQILPCYRCKIQFERKAPRKHRNTWIHCTQATELCLNAPAIHNTPNQVRASYQCCHFTLPCLPTKHWRAF